MTIPLFSVLIPVFNHEKYIKTAIQSVLSQTCQDFELILIDDASSDASWERAQSFAGDPRVKLLRHAENRGASATLNHAFSLARGNWLAILNSDDFFLPGRLEACGALLSKGADLVGSDMDLVDEKDQIIASHWWVDAFEKLKAEFSGEPDWNRALLTGNGFMTTSNFVFRRALCEKLEGFRDYRYVPDYDFLLRALAQGAHFAWIARKLLCYRLHESNTITSAPLASNLECAQLLREHAAPLLMDGKADLSRFNALASQWALLERYIVEIMQAQKHYAIVEQETAWRRELEKTRDARRLAKGSGLLLCLSLYRKIRAPLFRFQRFLRSILRVFSPERRLRLPPARVESFEALRIWLEPRVYQTDCISIDIFDTLLCRCVEPPEGLHRRVAEELVLQLELEKRIGVTAGQVLEMRLEEERRLRQEARQSGNDPECSYDDLIAAWVFRLLGYHDTYTIKKAKEIEWALELLALMPMEGARDFLLWLNNLSCRGNLRIVAVSDMYLGKERINALLDHCGFSGLIDEVYVSSDYGVGKYSGRLHSEVLRREKVQKSRVVHIGDNLFSDMAAPSKMGIQGILFYAPKNRARRNRQALSARLSPKGGVWPGRMLCEIAAERVKTLSKPPELPEDAAFFYRYGIEILGPAFSVFMLGLIERLRELRPDRVFFLARDGFLFQKLYRQYANHHSGKPAFRLPQDTYLHISRSVVANASIEEGMSLSQAQVAFYNPKQKGLLSIFKTYGLDKEIFRPFAHKHGFTDIETPITDWKDPRLLAFLADEKVIEKMQESGRKARALLKDWLFQQGFFGKERIALVDIGWNGTIQKFIVDAFGKEPGFPKIHGFYFALRMHMYGEFAHGGSIEGIMADSRRQQAFERAPFDFEELFEQGARALEATTVAYQRKDGQVFPVKKPDDTADRQQEIACNAQIQSLQQGVETFFEHFLAAQQLTGFNFQSLHPYALALLERAVVYPSPEEVKAIGQLAHTEDFGHDHVLDLSGQPVGWKDFLHPRRLFARLRYAPWHYAPLAGWFSPWGAWAMRYLHIKKTNKI